MNNRLKYIILILAFFGGTIASAAYAQEDNSVSSNAAASASYEDNLKRWQNMSEEQREAIRQKVNAMDAQQREAILENAHSFKLLSKVEQEKIRNNYQKFQGLSNEKKKVLIENVRRFRGLSPEQKERLRREVRRQRGQREYNQFMRRLHETVRNNPGKSVNHGQYLKGNREEKTNQFSNAIHKYVNHNNIFYRSGHHGVHRLWRDRTNGTIRPRNRSGIKMNRGYVNGRPYGRQDAGRHRISGKKLIPKTKQVVQGSVPSGGLNQGL